MSRPLSDPVPLRETSAWPGYADARILPRVYGRARVQPIRYSGNGTLFVLADHALEGVDAVTLDGATLPGWTWRNGSDMTGHPVAFLQLASAPESGVLAADVRGLSGSPADIINDLYPRSDLAAFARACLREGIVLGGALTERKTLRATLQFIADQAGAAWSAGLPGFATRFPPLDSAPVWGQFGPGDLADWTADCALETLATRVTAAFDWNGAAGKAQQSVRLEAPAAVKIHGDRPATLDLPWIREPRIAAQLAERWLVWRARPLWTLRFTAGPRFRDIPPGGWIDVQHPRLPQSGRYVVLDLEPGMGTGTVSIVAQAPAGDAPALSTPIIGAVFDAT